MPIDPCRQDSRPSRFAFDPYHVAATTGSLLGTAIIRRRRKTPELSTTGLPLAPAPRPAARHLRVPRLGCWRLAASSPSEGRDMDSHSGAKQHATEASSAAAQTIIS